jgi:RNA-dependent RNA polymerase
MVSIEFFLFLAFFFPPFFIFSHFFFFFFGCSNHRDPDYYSSQTVNDLKILLKKAQTIQETGRIPLPKSAFLLGVCDTTGTLQPGQVFLQLTNEKVGTGPVVISRNPCLHPGDVRILNAVDAPQLKHLFDVIVFPTTGNRPHCNEIAGGDLDGDLYFVSWDKTLTSINQIRPMSYKPAPASKPEVDPHSDATLKDYFIKSASRLNLLIGLISNLHMVN